jgi:membrane associated rhomboid family serine protease
MANIHGLDDLPARNVGTGAAAGQEMPNSLWDSLKTVLCPRFELYSVTSLIMATSVGLFIVLNLVAWGTGVEYPCVLYKCGGLYPPDLHNFEIHRLVMSFFLHLNFMHLFSNVITLFLAGYSAETTLGRLRYLGLIFGASISGSLISALINPNIFTVGASGGILGIFGVIFLDLYYKRHQMDTRSYTIMGIFMLFFLLSIFGSQGRNAWTNMGGLVFGVLYGIAHIPRQDAEPWHVASLQYVKIAVYAFPALILFAVLVRSNTSPPICGN